MPDKKNTKLDLVFVYTAYSLRYLYLFLLIPYFSRVLGPEGYGVVLAAMSLMQVIWLLVNWGFSLDGTREIAITEASRYHQLFSKHFTSRLILTAVSIIIGGIAIYYSVLLKEHWLAGIYAVLLGIVSAFNLGWYFNGSERPRKAVTLEALGFGLNLLFILLLVRGPNDSDQAIASILVSSVISTLLGHWWIRKEIKPVKPSASAGIGLIKKTTPIFIYTSSVMMLGASSTYLLSTLSTADQVGFFGSAERLVNAGLSLMAPMGAIFIPKVTILFNQNRDKAFKAVQKVLLALLAIGLTGLFITHFAGKEIVHIIFGEHFDQSVPILQTLAIIFPFYACTLVISTYVFIPLEHEKLLAKITIFGAVVNIVLAFLLASQYEGLGMAYARVISEVIIFVVLMFSCYKLGILQKLLNSNAKLGIVK